MRKFLVASLALLASLSVSAQVKEYRLPTAADGEVLYRSDVNTGLPLSAKDDRAEVVAVALTFLPKKQGEGVRWAYYYALQFKPGAVPKTITVYAEDHRPLKFEVADIKPVLQGGVWSATSEPKLLDKKTWDSMIGKDTWFLQRKFVIDYADGYQRTLHQLSIVTTPMRLELLEKVSGQKLLAPAPAPSAAKQ